MIHHAKYMVQPLNFTPIPNPMVCGSEMNLLLNMCLGKASVLEIGTWKGFTTANLLMTGCDVVTVDVTQPPKSLADGQAPTECLPQHEIGAEIPKDLLEHCRMEVYNPNQPNGLKELLARVDQRYDVVVIDGDHSYHGVSTDYNETLPYLRDGGFMLFHDCWWDVVPHPVHGPMRLLEEKGGIILNRSHYGMLMQDLEKLWLI